MEKKSKNSKLGFKIIAGIIGASSIISCNKKEITPQEMVQVSQETPTVTNGRLQFSSIDAFASHLKTIQNLPIKSSSARKEFVSYYESQLSVYENGKNMRTSDDLEEIIITDTTYIPNSFLASVINEKREVGIGNDSVYKFGSDYTFVYKSTDTSYISQFYADVKSNLITVKVGELYNYKNKIRVAKTLQSILNDSVTTATNSGGKRTEANISQESYFNANEKVSGQVYSTNYFFYSCFGAKTFAQKRVTKRFLLWTSQSWGDLGIGELYFKCTGYSEIAKSQCKGCGTGGLGGNYIEWEQKIQSGVESNKTIAELYGFNLPKIQVTDIKSYHFGRHWGVKKEVTVTGNLY